jgi:hypothetical protein
MLHAVAPEISKVNSKPKKFRASSWKMQTEQA